MSRSACTALWTLALAAAVAASSPRAALADPGTGEASSIEDPFVARVYYDDASQIGELSDFDLLEYNNREERYVLALVSGVEYERLAALGFRVAVDEAGTAALAQERPPGLLAGIPGFPCYRTVEETFALAQSFAVDYPDLATWTDVGDSWEKVNALGGYDIRVLKLTNSLRPGPKPKLIVTSSIHAREYTPAELSTRFAEYLVYNYDLHADVTWLLDHHEIHLVLQANPDGRKHAEAGQSWRKNTNQNYCGPTSNNRGVDLNRNFPFRWGCCGGSSTSQCSLTYRGPSAASDPETQAIRDYVLAELPDQRLPPLDSPAPLDATGLYLDTHSAAGLVLWPWGFPGTAPNSAQLQRLGRKFAYFNGYTPEQAIDLYVTDGTTLDFAYGELGVAAFTFELGTQFFQDCSTFENTILPDNLEALIYAAKVARTPYMTPAGPDALAVQVTPASGDAGTSRNLTATADDSRFNQTNGAEAVQNVIAAEYYIDVPPWETAGGPTAFPLTAADGAYDEPVEGLTATVSTASLAAGRHILFVRARDAAANWGPISAAFFYVTQAPQGTITGTVTDAVSGLPLAATVVAQPIGTGASTSPATGVYTLNLAAGTWTVRASSSGHLDQVVGNVVVAEGGTVVLDFALPPIPPILIVDDDDNAPDVRASYTQALDSLGEAYATWDTANGDFEPQATDLVPFEAVIWFTGDEFGGAAGPAAAGEAALASWLDGGRCLLVASQDYYRDRGLTPFMQGHLGVQSASGEAGQTSATGQGAFLGLGPYALSFPYTNATDVLLFAPSAESAFNGSAGNLGVARDTGFYRTTYWAFGLETLPTAAARSEALGAFLAWCAELKSIDADGDGVSNGADCSPLDPDLWEAPSPARNLRLSKAAADNLTWQAPQNPGAAAVVYDLLSSGTLDFTSATCAASGISSLGATDATAPQPDKILCYLVRARNACGGNLGSSSSGSPRSGPACP